MALSIVNIHVPSLSWKKKSLPNKSLLGKPKISPKRCNALQPKCIIKSNDNISISHEDEIEKHAHSWNDEPPIFPSDFVFGAASSAFQVEGATNYEGKGPSIWDTFCKENPDKIFGRATGEPGAGSYHNYEDDVDRLADIGLKAYRFSISWSRVLPNGTSDKKNEAGIKYYHNLIDYLQTKGIEPYVTLFHWDVPQALEDKYGGFLSQKIVEDYKNYAELCFKEFGGKVKNWITMNEPTMFCTGGYSTGNYAPGHCTPGLPDHNCPVGDSLREPYKVAHNILLAHAEAVNLYKTKYQAKQGGQVGMTLVTLWYETIDDCPLTIEAQKRALDFNLGWFLDPLKFGNYPFSMGALVGDRLPNFTDEESEKLKGSFDFIGLNYYTARYVKDVPYNFTNYKLQTSHDDGRYEVQVERANVLIGPAETNSWVNVFPKGLYRLLKYIKKRYNNPSIYITENGVLKYNTDQTKSATIQTTSSVTAPPIDDIFRKEYHTLHLQELEHARSEGVDVRGYFVWSLLDSFEWNDGYKCQFGLIHVDYKDSKNLKRTPKKSAQWLKDYLNTSKHKNAQLIEEEAHL